MDGVRGGEEGTEVISCGQTAPLSVDRDERIDHGKSALLVFIRCLNHSCSLWHLLLVGRLLSFISSDRHLVLNELTGCSIFLAHTYRIKQQYNNNI